MPREPADGSVPTSGMPPPDAPANRSWLDEEPAGSRQLASDGVPKLPPKLLLLLLLLLFSDKIREFLQLLVPGWNIGFV